MGNEDQKNSIGEQPAQTWTKPDIGSNGKTEYPSYQGMPRTQEAQLEEALVREEVATAKKIFPEKTEEEKYKETALEKSWVRFILTILAWAMLLIVAAFWYWYLKINK